jgi:hypothetical protein
MDVPMVIMSYDDNADPNREMHRTLRALPSVRKSSTEKQTPSCAFEKQEMLEPMRAEARVDTDEPKWKKSKSDTEEPTVLFDINLVPLLSREKLRMLSVEPACT